jgi:hypothetical protein
MDEAAEAMVKLLEFLASRATSQQSAKKLAPRFLV